MMMIGLKGSTLEIVSLYPWIALIQAQKVTTLVVLEIAEKKYQGVSATLQ